LLNFLGGGGGVKQPGHGVGHTLPSSTEVVEFYLYMSGPHGFSQGEHCLYHHQGFKNFSSAVCHLSGICS